MYLSDHDLVLNLIDNLELAEQVDPRSSEIVNLFIRNTPFL